MIHSVKSILKRRVPSRYCQQLWLMKKYISSFYYYGSKVHCPFCHGNFRYFLPFGIPQRLNSRCPRCGSLERYRLLYLYLKDKTAFFSDNLKVLEIGPAYCLSKLCKSLPNIEYTSVDIVPARAMIQMDISRLGFEDGSFDSIMCYHVLDDVRNDSLAMREMLRVLKPGGWAIVQVPIDINKASTLEVPSPSKKIDLRIYGLDFKHKLEDAGFQVRLEQYINELDDEIIRKYGLKDRYMTKHFTTCEDIYFCSKPV